MKRVAYACVGGLMLMLGMVGIVTPLLPTVPFLILAAWCFGRSSPRVEAWMLDHPRFGPSLQRWREHGAIPRRAKGMAVAGMTIGYALFWLQVRPGWLLATAVAALLIGSAAYVVSRPEPVAKDGAL
ncbi:MAG: YbaN family protein [Hyphomicrobiales bacterium]|nr:YbaN family protein [Hyphomicrobiales bacterium]